MKVCLIGNSYSIAVKHAIETGKGPMDGNTTFVMSPGAELELAYSGNSFTAVDKRSRVAFASDVTVSAVEIADYDAFVLMGFAVVAGQALRLYNQGFRTYAQDSKTTKLLSRAAFVASVKGYLTRSQSFHAAEKLRALSDKPILIIPQPTPLSKLKTHTPQNKRQEEIAAHWTPAFDDTRALEFEALFVEAATELAAGLGATFLPQPEETRTPFFTLDRYQVHAPLLFRRSAREAKADEVEDLGHMNAEYGAVIVRQIEQYLGLDRDSGPDSSLDASVPAEPALAEVPAVTPATHAPQTNKKITPKSRAKRRTRR